MIVTDLNGNLAQRRRCAQIEEAGGRASALALDVTDDAACRAAVDRVLHDHGRIDILHSHAGIQIPGQLEDMTPEQMDAGWALNVRAHFVLAQAIIPRCGRRAADR